MRKLLFVVFAMFIITFAIADGSYGPEVLQEKLSSLIISSQDKYDFAVQFAEKVSPSDKGNSGNYITVLCDNISVFLHGSFKNDPYSGISGDQIIDLLNIYYKKGIRIEDYALFGLLYSASNVRSETEAYIHLDVLEWLFAKDINVNAVHKTPLQANAIEISNFTPLHLAVLVAPYLRGILIEHGANVNAKTSEGYTALLIAEKLYGKDSDIYKDIESNL